MRIITLLFVLFVITACAAPSQALQETRTEAQTFTNLGAEPSTSSKIESAVPLVEWNVALQRSEIQLVDPITGQFFSTYPPISLGTKPLYGNHAYSADSKQLAIIESNGSTCEAIGGGISCRGSADILDLIDVTAWRKVSTPLDLKGWVGPLTFNPAATVLALTHIEPQSSTIILFDTRTGKRLHEQPISFRPSQIAFTQDGRTLTVYGQPLSPVPGFAKPDPPRVLVLDSSTLQVKWDQPLANILSGSWCQDNCQAPHEERLVASWTPAVVFSQDGQKLYLIHADEDQLTTVDLMSQTIQSVEIRRAESSLEWFLAITAGVAEAKGGATGAGKSAVLSPDGTKLYLVGGKTDSTRDQSGEWQTHAVSYNLQEIDVKNGHILATSEGKGEINISPDGKYLLLSGRDADWWTEVRDANSLQPVARVEQWLVQGAPRLDGQSVYLASQPGKQPIQLAVLDPRTFTITHISSMTSDASWLPLQ